MLKFQYHFTCKCCACDAKDMIDFQDRFSALKCSLCGGPIKNPNSESSLSHKMPCFDCGVEQEYKEQIQQVFLAYDLYRKVSDKLNRRRFDPIHPAYISKYVFIMIN